MSLKKRILETLESSQYYKSKKLYDLYDSYNLDEIKRDNNIEISITNSNTPILYTPFTVGMEFEPNTENAIYYSTDYDNYDRKTIFKSSTNKSIVTIEENNMKNVRDLIEDDEIKLDDKCNYNIELNIGVLGIIESSKLYSIIKDKYYFMYQIESELEEFKYVFYNRNKDNNIRRLHINQTPLVGFSDCALSKQLSIEEKKSSKFYYTEAYENPDNLIVTPQITLGISYGLYTILMNETYKNNIIQTISTNINNLIKEKNYNTDTNTFNIFNGFILVIINYCLIAAYYHNRDIVKRIENQGIEIKCKGFKYFKSLFPLKPRTNLAESYRYLKSEYTDFSKLFDKIYENTISKYNKEINKYDFEYSFDPNIVNDYTKLVSFHINVIKEITSRDILLEDINKRLDNSGLVDDSDIYQDIVSFIINKESHFLRDLLKIIGLINMIYLMYQIKNPKKVVRLKFLDRSKVGSDCKILDGYFFSYEGNHKKNIDGLESKGLVEVIDNKVYDFAHTSDPIILTTLRGKICTMGKRREELFELMPTNSNLVIEFRNPEVMTDNFSLSRVIPFYNILPFLREFFKNLNIILLSELSDILDDKDDKDDKDEEKRCKDCILMFKHKN
jgi:hypothetical protein